MIPVAVILAMFTESKELLRAVWVMFEHTATNLWLKAVTVKDTTSELAAWRRSSHAPQKEKLLHLHSP